MIDKGNDMKEEYLLLLRQLVQLQQKLIQAFEREIEIISLQPNFPGIFGWENLKYIIKPGLTISEILRAWPAGSPWIPLVLWTKPRIGVMQLQEQNWLFIIHGTMEIRFVSLPATVDRSVLASLAEGRLDVLEDMPISGIVVETGYQEKGRTDGILAKSVYEFASSIDSKVKKLSEAGHQKLLEDLAEEEVLLRSSESESCFFLAI